jgi:hypothetical protein
VWSTSVLKLSLRIRNDRTDRDDAYVPQLLAPASGDAA